MKKTMASLLLLTILTLIPISISPVEAVSDINILSNQGYVASTGYYYIVGEVQNAGSQPQKYVEITATFYSSNGTMVGTDNTFTEMDVIHPGCKSPFKLIFVQTQMIPQIDHYSLLVSSSIASSLPGYLEILSNSSYVSTQTGSLHVIGEIQNLGSGKATYVRLIATFYDQTGKVVAEDYTFSDPYNLDSGQKAPFDLMFIETERVPLIKSYALTADSLEYALQGSVTPSPSASPSPTPAASPTATLTHSPSPTATLTQTPTATTSPSLSASTTPTHTSTPTQAPTATPYYQTPTPSPSIPEFPQTIMLLVVAAVSLIITFCWVAYRRRNSHNLAILK